MGKGQTAGVGSWLRKQIDKLSDKVTQNETDINALETATAGKANATHGHAISDVTNLQSTIDGLNSNLNSKITDISTGHAIGGIGFNDSLNLFAEIDGQNYSIPYGNDLDTINNHTTQISNLTTSLNNKINRETGRLSGLGFDGSDTYVTIDGNKWALPHGYSTSKLNSELDAKQDAKSAITTSNISTQSVKYASMAGSANTATSASSAGNADTVDGHHVNFLSASGLSFSVPQLGDRMLSSSNYINDEKPLHALAPGNYWINGYGTYSDMPSGFENSHFMLLVAGNNGYVIQIAIGKAGGAIRIMTGSPSEWGKLW